MAQGSYKHNKLFVASCIALVTTAMAFSIRADILKELGTTFDISHEQQGLVNLMGIWGFPIAILIVGPLVNTFGMGRLLKLHVWGIFWALSSRFSRRTTASSRCCSPRCWWV